MTALLLFSATKWTASLMVLKGTEAKILSDVVAQFYAYLSGCMFNDPVGMAIYVELHYMMSSLMVGEWFE